VGQGGGRGERELLVDEAVFLAAPLKSCHHKRARDEVLCRDQEGSHSAGASGLPDGRSIDAVRMGLFRLPLTGTCFSATDEPQCVGG
jgi:hypothetical protein